MPRVAAHTLVAALLASAILALPAAGSPPKRGEFVPGQSLAGVRLGMTKQQVLRTWGKRHGVCRSCPRETWYFNYQPFTPEGSGVVLQRGLVVHLFTVWRPAGWRTPEGLVLGAPVTDISRHYGSLDRRECTSYYALLQPGKRAQTVFYVFRNALWGFGLTRPDASPCL